MPRLGRTGPVHTSATTVSPRRRPLVGGHRLRLHTHFRGLFPLSVAKTEKTRPILGLGLPSIGRDAIPPLAFGSPNGQCLGHHATPFLFPYAALDRTIIPLRLGLCSVGILRFQVHAQNVPPNALF